MAPFNEIKSVYFFSVHIYKCIFKKVPLAGLEPAANGLGIRYSIL